MAVQNISYKLLQQHLAKLVSLGLLDYEGFRRTRLFSTTRRGIAALRCYRNAMALLNGQSSTCPLVNEADRELGEIVLFG